MAGDGSRVGIDKEACCGLLNPNSPVIAKNIDTINAFTPYFTIKTSSRLP
jgi:hypothetical protein